MDKNNGVKLNETIQSTEMDTLLETNVKKKKTEKLQSASIKFRNALRHSFAQKCEHSRLSRFLDNAYFAFLGATLRVPAIFLVSFATVSLIFSYITQLNGFMFLLTTENFPSFLILAIGLLFFTSKKTIGDLISSSKFFSQFGIVYNQSAIFEAHSTKKGSYSYSTAMFVGILSGMLTFVFPAENVLYLIVFLLLSVLVFARPECGLLVCTFCLPLFGESTILILMVLTFFSLIYKYLRGKRHIHFDKVQILMIICCIYFAIRGIFSNSKIKSPKETLGYVSFILICITCANLVRATSSLIKTINLIVFASRVYILAFICNFIAKIVFGSSKTALFLSNLAFSGLATSLENTGFFISILSVAVPLNFAIMILSKNARDFFKNALLFAVMLACSTFVSSFSFTLILLLSCVVVLAFIKCKFVFLSVVCPLISHGLIKLFELFVPEKYKVLTISFGNYFPYPISKLIKSNFIFGIGFGEENYARSASKFADSSASPLLLSSSSAVNALLFVGVFGIVLLLAIICVVSVQNAHFICDSKKKRPYKVKTLSSALFAATLSFVACCIYTHTLSDFRATFPFALVLTLGYCAKQCIDGDFIDIYTVREYKQF